MSDTGGVGGTEGVYRHHTEEAPQKAESPQGKSAGGRHVSLPQEEIPHPSVQRDHQDSPLQHPEKRKLLDAELTVVTPEEKHQLPSSSKSAAKSPQEVPMEQTPQSLDETFSPIDHFNPKPLPASEEETDVTAVHSKLQRRHSFTESLSLLDDDLTPVQSHSAKNDVFSSASETSSMSSTSSLKAHFEKNSLRVLKFSMDRGATFWVRHKINSCSSREQFEALRYFITEQNPKLYKKLRASLDKKDAALSLGLDLKLTERILKAIDKSDFKSISKQASKLRKAGAITHLQEFIRERKPHIYHRLFTPASSSEHQLVLRSDISDKVKKAYTDGMDTTKVSTPADVIAMTTAYLKAAKEFSETKCRKAPTAAQREALYQGLVGLGSRYLNISLAPAPSGDTNESAALQLANIAYDLHQVKDVMATPNPAMPKGQTDIITQAGIYLPKDKKLLFENTLGLMLLSKASIENDKQQAVDRKKELEGRLGTATDSDKTKLADRIKLLEEDIKVYNKNLEQIRVASDSGMQGQDELFRDCFNSMVRQLESQLKLTHLSLYEAAEDKDRQILVSPLDILNSAASVFKERAESRAKSVTQKDTTEDAKTFLKRVTAEKLDAVNAGVYDILTGLVQRQD